MTYICCFKISGYLCSFSGEKIKAFRASSVTGTGVTQCRDTGEHPSV